MMVEILAGIIVFGIAAFVLFGLFIVLLKSFDTADSGRKQGVELVHQLEEEHQRYQQELIIRERAARIEREFNHEWKLQNGPTGGITNG